jgi:hypothetical protein
VAESLARIKPSLSDKGLEKSGRAEAGPVRTLTRLNKMVKLLAASVVVLVIAGILAWFQLGQRKEDISSILEEYANQYAPSVAFLATEYWLEADNVRYYANLTEDICLPVAMWFAPGWRTLLFSLRLNNSAAAI